MNINTLSISLSLLIISSCTSIETQDYEEVQITETKIDYDQIFEEYLDNDWEKTLSENPLFASYTGDKRLNNKINSNSIEQFIADKSSNEESLRLLREIDSTKLSKENKLNYKLKEFGLLNSIGTQNFPTYYLRLNQRGGIQSFYETGNRLVYTTKKDYYDWLERLHQFVDNIDNFREINKKGLETGHTQPKLVTRGVISQIESITSSDIESNPYLKVFLEADDNILTTSEKADLINDAKKLIENKINPAYKKLNNFLKDEYLPKSRNSIGIKDIPNGKEYYEFLAKFYTTTKKKFMKLVVKKFNE